MTNMPRVCVTCQHFRYEAGHPDLSDITPGSDASIWCNKSRWYYDSYDTTESQYREIMLTALECDHYAPVVLPSKSSKGDG